MKCPRCKHVFETEEEREDKEREDRDNVMVTSFNCLLVTSF